MAEIDSELSRLVHDRVPASLAGIDSAVLQAVSGHDFSRPQLSDRHSIAAIAFALLIGVGGGLAGNGSHHARPAVAPIGAAAELAPSTLLTEG